MLLLNQSPFKVLGASFGLQMYNSQTFCQALFYSQIVVKRVANLNNTVFFSADCTKDWQPCKQWVTLPHEEHCFKQKYKPPGRKWAPMDIC
jgi:hypothetical protein